MPQTQGAKLKKKPAAAAASPLTGLLAAAILAALGLAVYGNSFQNPFVLDDAIVLRNLSNHQIWPWQIVYGANRPVGFLTFGLNYLWGGDNVWGYHAVNVAIHVASGCLLYGLVRRTLARPPLANRYAAASAALAFAAASIWLVHPLQTESVTYIYQRLEALLGLFYLLTLYGFVRAQDSTRPLGWYAASVLACALGMGTKEVMVAAPLVVLWYDRALVASNWREIAARRWKYYSALASTWAILAFLLIHTLHEQYQGGVLIVKGLTPLDYALSQPGVILHYVRLCFWPSDLCLYYCWPVAKTAWQIVPPALVLAMLLGATVYCLMRRPALGFLGGWFFLILAPTSSVAPIKDLAFEHRMYLPLAAVSVLATLAGYEAWRAVVGQSRSGAQRSDRRRAALLPAFAVLLVVAALGLRSRLRNEDYRSPLELWEKTVQTAPESFGAHDFLAMILLDAGQTERALAELDRAVQLKPDFVEAFNNRCAAYERSGKLELALADANRAIDLDPDYFPAYHNRAAIHERLGRSEPALQDLTTMIKLMRDPAPVYRERANVSLRLARFAAAKRDYDESLRLDPDSKAALNERAWLLATCPDVRVRSGAQAVDDATRACELSQWKRPEFLDTLAAAYAERGDFEKAVRWETKAVNLAPVAVPAAGEFEQRRKLYQAGKPFHDAPAVTK